MDHRKQTRVARFGMTARADVLDAPAPRRERRRSARMPQSRGVRGEGGGTASPDERRRMTERSTSCPSCTQAGVAVDRITLKALLTADGLRRGVPAQPRYCGNADCPIVYFGVDGEVTF